MDFSDLSLIDLPPLPFAFPELYGYIDTIRFTYPIGMMFHRL